MYVLTGMYIMPTAVTAMVGRYLEGVRWVGYDYCEGRNVPSCNSSKLGDSLGCGLELLGGGIAKRHGVASTCRGGEEPLAEERGESEGHVDRLCVVWMGGFGLV